MSANNTWIFLFSSTDFCWTNKYFPCRGSWRWICYLMYLLLNNKKLSGAVNDNDRLKKRLVGR